ncbi:HupE/UreJ family protein [Pseudohongiella sp. O18]|uniref:HupE/UreJ family protein n=1 Tax=Pseudohongiella sp. O18 TaxID=2904248 RepID=UPI001F2648E4|nr:HupE/UreJ family protein [Pseudohongiella sp. O18]
MKRRLMSIFVLPLLCLVASGNLSAHTLSDSYLNLSLDQQSVSGHWLIAVEDLELAIGLDGNADSAITWGEISQHRSQIREYAASRLTMASDGQPCSLEIGTLMIEQLNAGPFVHLPITGLCNGVAEVTLSYSLMFDIDSAHRGILSLRSNDETYVRVFSPDTATYEIDTELPSDAEYLWTFFIEGIWHIWIGLDHILFLLALLVAIVLVKTPGATGQQQPANVPFSTYFYDVIKVVTAFTIAHSITLILATLEVVSLPGRFVESVIALSVAISGINILYPLFRTRAWQFAFIFGLIHGFGFAGVLGDLALPQQLLFGSLLSFNIGVEVGQIAIVLVLVPILALLGRATFSRRLALGTAGLVITVFGVLWLLERSLSLSVPVLS